MSTPSEARPRLLVSTLLVGLVAALISFPTTGDFGLTWDEPAYRYSQIVSGQWWEHLAQARSVEDLHPLVDPDQLLYAWQYGRHGINFHPPLAGQLNLATFGLTGRWFHDIVARRFGTVLELVLTVTVLYHFLARRSNRWVGLTASGTLLLMPRVYGHGHIAGTDMPGMLIWALVAMAAWKGMTEPGASLYRALTGVLIGLGFLVKMAVMAVILPLFGWIFVSALPYYLFKATWRELFVTLLTTLVLVTPSLTTLVELQRLRTLLPEPNVTDLFEVPSFTTLPSWLLLLPLVFWSFVQVVRFIRRRQCLAPTKAHFGIAIWEATLAFGPALAWLGNPAWWRETFPRLAHYMMLTIDRESALPDIRIHYLDETYLFSLPWHNAWVLIGVTVPILTLVGALVGSLIAIGRVGTNRLPLYFLIHACTLPILRMLPTPSHDGVRLMLPTFVFLGGLAGWGVISLADGLVRLLRRERWRGLVRSIFTMTFVGWSLVQLWMIHPYELSYYNRLVGGPSGAKARGFELSYWYDAFTPKFLERVNATLPDQASIVTTNQHSRVPTFMELQELGDLRSDLQLESVPDEGYPFVWLLTHDSKADSFSKLLFAMEPIIEDRPKELGGLRVAAVAGPDDAARALALSLLLTMPSPPRTQLTDDPKSTTIPLIRPLRTVIDRFRGVGLTRPQSITLDRSVFDWARRDPEGLKRAARELIDGSDRLLPERMRLMERLSEGSAAPFANRLIRYAPEALLEAIALLIDRPEALREVLLSAGYTEPALIGGPLEP